MIVAVDFDGVVVEECYPEIGKPMPYAREALAQIQEAGHSIIIHTCRTGQALKDCQDWLRKGGYPHHRINEPDPDNVARYGPTGAKIFAHVYIDDRNLGGFPGWPQALERLGLDPFALLKPNDDYPY